MSNKIPMVFSVKASVVSAPLPKSVPPPTINVAPIMRAQSNARFSMHDLYKVAKKGCKSCGS